MIVYAYGNLKVTFVPVVSASSSAPQAITKEVVLVYGDGVPPATATASTVLLRRVSLFYQRWHAATGYPATRPSGARHTVMATGSDCAADAHASGAGVATVCARRLCA